MIYLKWKLSNGVWGTGPEGEIFDRGGFASAGWALDNKGYRIGYLTGSSVDLTGLETWDVTEVTESEALAFCRQFYSDTEVLDDETISSPPPQVEIV
jgi:hypothetical protein